MGTVVRLWLQAGIAVAVLASLAPAANGQALPLLGPDQVHVTLADDGGLVLQWAVTGAGYSTQDLPWVGYSLDGSTEEFVLADLAGTVVQGGPTGSAGGASTSFHYAATVPAQRGQTVTYRVGSDTRGMTEPFTVRNVPPADAPLRFLAYGDIGVDNTAPDGGRAPQVYTENPSVQTVAHAHLIRDLALQQDADLWTILGDLSYDNSGMGWAKFLRFAQPLQATVVSMPVAGNHEFDEEGGLGYTQFLNAYVLPGDEQFYAYEAGPVTFIAINSDSLCGPAQPLAGSPQEPCYGKPGIPDSLAWLEGQLAAAQADANPWTIVAMHHPVWSWGRHGSSQALISLLSPLFEQYGVDVVLTAHDHLYSRTYPLRGEQVMATGSEYAKGAGPVYIVLGGGGRALYDVPTEEPPAWHAASEKVHHLSVWDANATSLAVQVLREDGSLLDGFRISGTDGPRQASDDDPARQMPLGLLALGGLFVALLALRRRDP